MKNINYPGVDATGMSRKEFYEKIKSFREESKSSSTNFLEGYIKGYTSSYGIIGRFLTRIFPHSESLELRVFREELLERYRRMNKEFGD